MFAKKNTRIFFFRSLHTLFGFIPVVFSLVLIKLNDILLKKIIDWMFVWVGIDCPPVHRPGLSSSKGLNMISPSNLQDMIASSISEVVPHTNHKSQLMRHKTFSFQPPHKHGAVLLLLQQQHRGRRKSYRIQCVPTNMQLQIKPSHHFTVTKSVIQFAT